MVLLLVHDYLERNLQCLINLQVVFPCFFCPDCLVSFLLLVPLKCLIFTNLFVDIVCCDDRPVFPDLVPSHSFLDFSLC